MVNFVVFPVQESGDEEPGDDEEDVDADPATVESCDSDMGENHKKNSESTEALNIFSVLHSRAA
ncbi:unannotated protein [freshwater metagenome]|uniref:Unannotated protein n=1 Tax=freshwater metagenome TaxID=449393 RepID=A0A6J7KYD7_9ZZZZ